MWGYIITVFLGLYGLMSFYIGRRGWTTFGKSSGRPLQYLYWIFFILLVLSFPIAELAEDVLPATITPWLTIWGGYSMVAVSYLFLLILIIDIIRFMDNKVGIVPLQIKEHKKTPLTLGAIVLVAVLMTTLYGGWNASSPVVNHYQITIDKNVSSAEHMKIAMISDIHYGAIIDTLRLERMLEMVDELNPDIILLAGDITDGSLPPGEGETLAAVLGKMQAPYGVWAVPGNHDRDLRDPNSELMLSLEKVGVHVLKDQYALVEDAFYIIGREDANRRGRMTLHELMMGVDSSKPLLLLDHQPNALEEAQEAGIDLQLSGHTHNGQVFPANFITGQIYEQDWGYLQKEAYQLIVSCGFGTWGPPLRIGNRPEIVSVEMTFN